MLFSEILGLDHIKNHLSTTVDKGRIPHAQLFAGPNGSGTLPMAIAYAQYILCGNKGGENQDGNLACNSKINKLSHPDLHFAFPVATTEKIKSNPICDDFIAEWREFVLSNPYSSLFDWYKKLGIEKKQGKIGKDEALEVIKKLSIKSYEGGYKAMIVWQAEKMNPAAANKLLKLIEEPPDKTLIILIVEDESQLLQTIRSRCQLLRFPPLGEAVIAEALKKKIGGTKAGAIARQANGSYSNALHILEHSADDQQFEKWFVTWVRTAFRSKGNKAAIRDLLSWSEEIAKTNRETQKNFLLYCMDFFRQAMLSNYGTENLVYLSPQTENFSLDKFAPFVHAGNILEIQRELQEAIFHIERNANGKIVFTDLSIKLTRLLHRKEMETAS
jgi:DNA polymerase-3 subunit delta'